MKPVPIAIKWKMHYANIIIEGLTAAIFFLFIYFYFFPLSLYGFLEFSQSDCNILTSGEMVGCIATQHIEDICGRIGTSLLLLTSVP